MKKRIAELLVKMRSIDEVKRRRDIRIHRRKTVGERYRLQQQTILQSCGEIKRLINDGKQALAALGINFN